MFYLRTLKNPAMYHGHQRQPDFFEGWYFKIIDATGDQRYAVIPGIFKHKNPAESHAFVQILDGITGESTYHRYDVSEFGASKTDFEVRVGRNRFKRDEISLDITSPDRQIMGTLRFENLTPWPHSLFAPGVMGPFAYLPFMECNHGVVSIDHAIRGELTVNDTTIDFSGGRGYIEKDWGASFPSGYIWVQTNHFEQPGTCLMVSIAMIPNLGFTFRGFLSGFWHNGTLYRFATYTGARINHLHLTDTNVQWQLIGRIGGVKYRLEVNAERASGGLLKAPYRVGMLERVVESLTATANVRLLKLNGQHETLIFQGTGRYAGLEVAGNLDPLLDKDLRKER